MAFTARTAAQNAADAAALAGAFSFVVDPSPTEASIRQIAIKTAAVNKVLGKPVEISDGDVDVDMGNRRVTVRVEQGTRTYLARVLSINSLDISVQAVAEASEAPTSSYCVKPWVLPSTALTPGDPCGACETGQVLLGPDGQKTVMPTGCWASSSSSSLKIRAAPGCRVISCPFSSPVMEQTITGMTSETVRPSGSVARNRYR